MRFHHIVIAASCSYEIASAWAPSLPASSQGASFTSSRSTMISMAYINPDGDAHFVGGSTSSTKNKLTEEEIQMGTENGTRQPTTDESNDETTRQGEFSGAGTLGDIMSGDENAGGPSKAGLVTLDGGTLAARFGIQSPLDRMALTANGNLQRLFSSYYDAPVHVVVKRSEQLLISPDTNPANGGVVWDRIVHLTVFDEVFCSAHSTVTIHNPECQHLVESGQVGLGQLFRYLDRLPTFALIDAGYNDDPESNNYQGLWRLYELRCNEVSCRIREDFHPRAWNMIPSQANGES